MADIEQHRAVLRELNRNYIRSVDEADVAWFDANLAADFAIAVHGPATLHAGDLIL